VASTSHPTTNSIYTTKGEEATSSIINTLSTTMTTATTTTSTTGKSSVRWKHLSPKKQLNNNHLSNFNTRKLFLSKD